MHVPFLCNTSCTVFPATILFNALVVSRWQPGAMKNGTSSMSHSQWSDHDCTAILMWPETPCTPGRFQSWNFSAQCSRSLFWGGILQSLGKVALICLKKVSCTFCSSFKNNQFVFYVPCGSAAKYQCGSAQKLHQCEWGLITLLVYLSDDTKKLLMLLWLWKQMLVCVLLLITKTECYEMCVIYGTVSPACTLLFLNKLSCVPLCFLFPRSAQSSLII